MHRWLFDSKKRSWMAYLLLMLLLAVATLSLAHQQFLQDRAHTESATMRETALLASIVAEALRRDQYQNVEEVLKQWGVSNANLEDISVKFPNGASLANYHRADKAKIAYSTSLPIAYSYHGHAVLTVSRDMSDIYSRHNALLLELFAIYFVMAGMLGLLMYFVFQRQREGAMLQAQTARLDTANIALSQEVAQRKKTEKALFDAKGRAEVTLHSIGDGVITTDRKGLVTYLNPVAEEHTGWRSAEAIGKPFASVFNLIDESSRLPAEDSVARCLHEGTLISLDNQTILIARDGKERAIEDSAAPILDHEGNMTGVVLAFHDVTQSRAMAQQLSWNATHDMLTGLINRREFEERVRQALNSSRASNDRHALLYVDLDQFKIVNDTCGHVAGDELLRQLSGLLQRQMRGTDIIARLGGDEFGVLLEHCPIEQATRIAEQLRDVTRQFRFMWDQKTFEISASIGVMAIHRDSGTLPQLLSAVDMACYVAKERGRNRYHVYQESDTDFARRHGEMLWVTRINQALREHRFVLHRQAIQSTQPPHSIHHYEVLLRIRNEDGTLSEPGSFLPAAERYDLMTTIDRWVITHLFTTQGDELRASASDLAPPTMAAINLSGASLNDDAFLGFVRTAMTEHAINPRQICFEITETVAISNLDRAVNFISTLRQLGCRFALDDFGSGLSSFGYLKNLPVDYLKIDGSLVRNVVDSPVDAAMVLAIHEIGHVMGLKTIAEYVESEALRQRLIEMGVDYMQGFAIEIPRPFDLKASQNEVRPIND